MRAFSGLALSTALVTLVTTLLSSTSFMADAAVSTSSCDLRTPNDKYNWDDKQLIRQIVNDDTVEIFKVHRIRMIRGDYAPTVFKTFRVIGGLATTYLLTNGDFFTICHGRLDKTTDFDKTFAHDEFLEKMVGHVGDRLDSLQLITNKRTFSKVGGDGGSKKTKEKGGFVIKSLQGVSNPQTIRDIYSPWFDRKPNANDVFRLELTGEVEFSEPVTVSETSMVDSDSGRITVDNSDPDATLPQSKSISFEEKSSRSETNEVTETFSTHASISVTAEASVGIKGVFDVGASTTATAGFGFEKSMKSSTTVTLETSRKETTTVAANAGEIAAGQYYNRILKYSVDWQAPARIYRYDSPNDPEVTVLTGTLTGEVRDSYLSVKIENTRVPDEGEKEDDPTDADDGETNTEEDDTTDSVPFGGSFLGDLIRMFQSMLAAIPFF